MPDRVDPSGNPGGTPVYTFEEVLERNTGAKCDPVVWRASQDRRRVLSAQNDRIAAGLENAGVPVFTDNGDTYLVGEITGCAERITETRRVRFLPLVAQKERAPMLRNLQGFIRESRRAPFLRFAVITAGERIPLGGPLRDAITDFQRRISKWASLAGKRHSIAVVFRGTEFTIDDALSFHVHANVLFAPIRKLPPDEWSEFLRWTWEFFGAHWQDNGRLLKPDEVVKYSFKPAEMERLSSEDLAWLFGQIQRLKLIQPLGEFADFCRDLKSARQKFGFIQMDGNSTLARITKGWRLPKEKDEKKKPGAPRTVDAENQLIARTAPMPRFTPYAEPCRIVRNFTPTPTTLGGQVALERLQEGGKGARAAWDANGAPCPSVALAQARGNGPPVDEGNA